MLPQGLVAFASCLAKRLFTGRPSAHPFDSLSTPAGPGRPTLSRPARRAGRNIEMRAVVPARCLRFYLFDRVPRFIVNAASTRELQRSTTHARGTIRDQA